MDKSEVVLILLIVLFACIALYLAIVLKELKNKKKKYYAKGKNNVDKKELVKNTVIENKKVEEEKNDNPIEQFNKIGKQEANDEYNFPELEQYQAYAFSRAGAYHAKQRNHQNILNQQYLDDELKK